MEDAVIVTNLGVRFGDLTALRDVTLSVPYGCVVAIVGPNGAGKTTLIRSLFGEEPNAVGRVRLAGLDPTVYKDRRRLWSVARWIEDETLLNEHLTVREQLRLIAWAFGVPTRFFRAAIDDRAIDFGLKDVLDRPIRELSFGTRRKAHLAGGFLSGVTGPRVIVMDEPMVGLDPESRIALFGSLRRFVRGGATERAVLISSHDLAELNDVADHIIMLNHGQVVASGSVRELASLGQCALEYELVLFEPTAKALANELTQNVGLPCEPVDSRTLRLSVGDREELSTLISFILTSTEHRIRELRESHSALARVFMTSLENTDISRNHDHE